MRTHAAPEDALPVRWGEVVAVAATGLLHLLVSNVLGLQGLFIAVALTAWIAYAVWRARRDPQALARWGFGRRGLRATWIATAVFGVVAGVVMAIVGHHRGQLRVDLSLWMLLLLYPVWGLIQQFLVQALVAGNLRRTTTWTRSAWFVAPACAVLFGIVHLPDVRLVGATFLLGLVFTPMYLRWRNLWPLGLHHGWLGALYYLWVLGRDPWTDVLG